MISQIVTQRRQYGPTTANALAQQGDPSTNLFPPPNLLPASANPPPLIPNPLPPPANLLLPPPNPLHNPTNPNRPLSPPCHPPSHIRLQHGNVSIVIPRDLNTELNKRDFTEKVLWLRGDFKAKQTRDGDVEESSDSEEEGADSEDESTNIRYRFIRNIDGSVVSVSVVSAMKKRMKGIFTRWEQEAARLNEHPPSCVTAFSDTQNDDLRCSMYTHFPLLRLCDFDWKLDKLAKMVYPGWKTDRKKRLVQLEKKRKAKALRGRSGKRNKNATTAGPIESTTLDGNSNALSNNVDQVYATLEPPPPSAASVSSVPSVPSAPSILPHSSVPSAASVSTTSSLQPLPSTSSVPSVPSATTPLDLATDWTVPPADLSTNPPSPITSTIIPTPLPNSPSTPPAASIVPGTSITSPSLPAAPPQSQHSPEAPPAPSSKTNNARDRATSSHVVPTR